VDDDAILNTREACIYLKISRPTFLKYIAAGKIKAQKIGNGWKVFKADLDCFVRGE
jgi:excisionase family DNA binding protein